MSNKEFLEKLANPNIRSIEINGYIHHYTLYKLVPVVQFNMYEMAQAFSGLREGFYSIGEQYSIYKHGYPVNGAPNNG